MESEMNMQKSIVLTNNTRDVPRLNAFVEEFCQGMGTDEMVAMQVKLAVEEAVVNVMNYAYPPGQQGNVNIEAAATQSDDGNTCITFTITDSGQFFDPTAKADVDITLAAEERQIGGLGIHIMRQNMDSINYRRINNLNMLTLSKQIKNE